MTIVRLCGTSGSGKTTVARRFIEEHHAEPLGPSKRPTGYKVKLKSARPLYIIGPYTAACGGCDSMSGWQEVMAHVHDAAAKGHVLYESLLMSTYYGAQGRETERYGQDHIWGFLDTPIDECIARIKARRLAAGNTKPLNEDNTRDRVRAINSLQRKLEGMGARAITIPHDKAYETVWSYFV